MDPDAIRAMISRGTLAGVDDSGDYQRIRARGFRSEELDEITRHQPFGLSSNPGIGAEGQLFRLGGRAERTIGFGFESGGSRPRGLPTGVVALYNQFGQLLKLLETKSDWDHGGKHSHERGIGRKKIEASQWVVVSAPAIYLGPGPWFPVLTSSGPSECVFASLGPAAPPAPTPGAI